MALESLRLEKFRGFRDLIIPKMGRVNLFVGKNSIGKSSLLEGLWLYFNKADPRSIYDVLVNRDEAISFSVKRWDEFEVRFPIKDIFYGRTLPSTGSDMIRIGPDPSAGQIWIEFSWDNDGQGSKSDFTQKALDLGIEPVTEGGATPILVVYDGGKKTYRLPLDQDPLTVMRRWGLREASEKVAFGCQLIPSSGLSAQKSTRFWDRVALSDLEADALQAVKIIDPEIERVATTGSPESPRERFFIIKKKGISEPIPLKSLGDGISRILNLSLAISVCKNGALMIDEIENGIHYSIQPKLWETLFALAERLNVQIFATTHSFDCIRGFQEAASSHPGEGMAFRLEERNGTHKAIDFTPEELGIAINGHWEVR